VLNAAFPALTLVISQSTVKWDLELTLECRAIGTGTATTFICQGRFMTPVSLLTGPTGPVAFLPASGAAAVGTGIDFTATNKIQTMATWSIAGQSLTCEQYEVTSLN
jgi:hypothetical protein